VACQERSGPGFERLRTHLFKGEGFSDDSGRRVEEGGRKAELQ